MFKGLWNAIQRWLQGGRTPEDLAQWLDVELETLRRVPRDYRTFHIQKRNGSPRRVDNPNSRLKQLQRCIHQRLLRGLRSHSAAHGFERGRSIVTNALEHANRAVVVNLDIVNFFPSTTAERVHQLFRACGWGEKASALLTQICTHEESLPQGAPTSPRLSNLVNFFLDVELLESATSHGARYTRYADDITFSFDVDDRENLHGLIEEAGCKIHRYGYVVHRRRKMKICRQHQRQEVTGLVVNERPRLSRKRRRWLRAVEHRRRSGLSATITREQIAGWKAFQKMVDRSDGVGGS